jgi:hypothetical protein
MFAMHYPVPAEAFTITKGSPKVNDIKHPTGLEMKAAFCPDCGTWLFKQADADPFKGWFLVQAGTTDVEPDKEASGYWVGAPEVELWVSQRAPWLGPVKGAEQKSEF